MTSIDKIRLKFKNLLRFDKLNPVDNFEMAEDFEVDYHVNNIDLFRNLISQYDELKEIIWVAIYHCLNTFDSSKEFLTVLDVNFEIIADLIEGDEEHVIIPEIIKKEILDGNVLATFHNHFQGAVIPSSKDFENTILPLIQYMVITSQGNIGIIINDSKCAEDNFNEFRRQWTLFYSFLNWSFYLNNARIPWLL